MLSFILAVLATYFIPVQGFWWNTLVFFGTMCLSDWLQGKLVELKPAEQPVVEDKQ